MVSGEMQELSRRLAEQEVELHFSGAGVYYFDNGSTRYYVKDESDGGGLMMWYRKNYSCKHTTARHVFELALARAVIDE